jgi:stearoyl-CoA desaturase (delta-9 desaturase)
MTTVQGGSFVRPLVNGVFMFVLPVLGALGALATLILGRVTSLHLVLFAVAFGLTGFGITIGYHRLLTHRSFETHPALKTLLLILGSMAVEGPARDWVSLHLQHHAHSDGAGDPHSPREGFFHAHWGWMLYLVNQRNGRYATAVRRDPVAMWVSNTFALWVGLGYLVPFLLGGWEGLIWGGLARQFAVQQVTFAVNSACHRWGTRPFTTNDCSRNNAVVGLLGLGEGWHNNHHAFPSSAFHGLRRWEIDLSGQIIRAFEMAHLAWRVQRPTDQQIQRRQQELATRAAALGLSR